MNGHSNLLEVAFSFGRPGEILVCKLEGTSFWEKTPGAYFVSHCFTLPEGNCNDCIRENDRSVEGKL